VICSETLAPCITRFWDVFPVSLKNHSGGFFSHSFFTGCSSNRAFLLYMRKERRKTQQPMAGSEIEWDAPLTFQKCSPSKPIGGFLPVAVKGFHFSPTLRFYLSEEKKNIAANIEITFIFFRISLTFLFL
jgi:hypothetical protein